MAVNISILNRKRKNKKGKIKKSLWVKFTDKEDRTKVAQYSLNTIIDYLGITQLVTTRNEARKCAILALEKGFSPFRDKDATEKEYVLADYLLSFWDFDTSEYISTKNKFKANSITRDTANKNIELIKRHVILSENNAFDSNGNRKGYYLPAGLKVNELTVSHMDNLQNGILFDRGLSPKSYKNILSAINPPLKELLRKDIILSNPIDKIVKPTVDTKETNIDAFTADEIDKICNYIMDNIYTNNGIEWINQAFSIILAAATGMRQSEILALQPKCIYMIEDSNFAAINVTRTHNDADGFKVPKNRRDRWTYCDKRLAKVLIALQSDPEGLIFEGHLGTKDKILGTKGIRERLDFIMNDLGITRSNGMKLVFHSLRHYANTQFNIRGSSDIANTIIGHTDSLMNERYYHPDITTMKEYSSICGSLIPETALIKIQEYFNQEYNKEK